MVHIGQKIKKVFKEKGMTVSEFGRRINKSRENVYSIFTRKTIDTGLLEEISNVLDYDFFAHYSKSSQTELNKLRAEVARLKEENLLLKEMNKLLKGKSKA